MAIITVTNAGDTPVADQIDLRQAVAAATSGDTIDIPSSLGTVTLDTPLEISGTTLTIAGADIAAGIPTLDFNNANGTVSGLAGLIVDAGASLTLQELTLGGTAGLPAAVSGFDGADGDDGDFGTAGQVNGTDGQPGGNGVGGNSPLTVSLIDNKGALALVDSWVVNASANGGEGGGGGNGGQGGNGGNGYQPDGADDTPGGTGGDGGAGGNGANGGNGGSAIAGILNESQATLTLRDSGADNNTGNGGEGGSGGDGGNGGAAGGSGSGVPNGGPANGGDGGNSGNGGDGGTGVGGIENLGLVNVIGAALIYQNSGVGGTMGSAGFAGGGGEEGLSGVLGVAQGTYGTPGAEGTDGMDGTAGMGVDNVLELGNVTGSLLTSGHFYDFDQTSLASPLGTAAPQATVVTGGSITLTYEVDAIGDPSQAAAVKWQVVTNGGGPAVVDFGGLSLPSGTITYPGDGDNMPQDIVLTLYADPLSPASESFSVVLSTITAGDAIGSAGTLTQAVTQVSCFAAGTRIETADGPVAVEALRPGVMVRTASGGLAPIVWLGHRVVDCRRHPRPRDVWPVRVRAGAFAPGVPMADVRLSPDHAVFAGGVLIPVRHLINGRTIAREPDDSVTYHHVELPVHDVILAEGLACESYLDTDNRGAFANGGPARMLHPDFGRAVWEGSGCAPLHVAGPTVEAVRRSLEARAADYHAAFARAIAG